MEKGNRMTKPQTVASLELCKELYELSGWIDRKELRLDYVVGKGVLPRYDLGYLLRKLPLGSQVYTSIGKPNKYYAHYHELRGEKSGFCEADTPEDAACKLAIELFKKGILK